MNKSISIQTTGDKFITGDVVGFDGILHTGGLTRPAAAVGCPAGTLPTPPSMLLPRTLLANCKTERVRTTCSKQ